MSIVCIVVRIYDQVVHSRSELPVIVSKDYDVNWVYVIVSEQY